LALNNVVLEVRRDGRRHVQSVRANGAMVEGARVTLSCENPLPSDAPDPSAIDDPALRQLVTPLPGLRLVAVGRLDQRRTARRLVAAEGGEILLTLHDGHVEAGKVVHPAADIELSLTGGDPSRLFRLALAIQADIPVRVASEPWDARALRQAGGKNPAWRKAVPLNLPDAASTEEALALILRHCLDHLIDNEACTRQSDHPEGVHQMRVAMRRMRSALRIFRPLLPAAPYARLTEEVRWITLGLAEARDLDVFTEEIVGPVAAAFPDEPSFDTLRQCLAAESGRARAAARATVASDRFTRFLLDAGAWIAGRAWRDQPVSETSSQLLQPITGLASGLLSARFKKVSRRGRRFVELSPAERHQLRIDVKKLRYAVDFFSSLYGRKRVRSFTENLQKLQDGLGYMNDVIVARQLVERLETAAGADVAPAIRRAGGILMGWHTRAAAEAARSLAVDVEALIANKPFWSADREEPA
jgi:CHAD domain-containing protein